MTNKEGLYGVIAVLLAALIVSSSAAAYYYVQYGQEAGMATREEATARSLMSRYGGVMVSNLLIDFGNGTRHWYNETRIEPGWNLFTETLAATNGNVNATCCAYGSHFVTGIEGIQSTAGSTKSWSVWTFNKTNSWQEASVGVDEIGVSNNSVNAWMFCAYDPLTYAPLCSP